jgi:hypothetical protein
LTASAKVRRSVRQEREGRIVASAISSQGSQGHVPDAITALGRPAPWISDILGPLGHEDIKTEHIAEAVG